MGAGCGLTEVDRLLRHRAREAVERLAARHADVHPGDLAISVVYSHFHVPAVRARREELILFLADFVRELRAASSELA